MVYKILAIDGGGIKGAFAIQVLKMIQSEVGKDVLDKFDCFAGTSTGALIVAALLSGYQPSDLLRFYTLFGKGVFPERDREGFAAKYDNKRLKRVLEKIFPENPALGDLKKDVIIPTCRLGKGQEGSWQPVVYDNFDRKKTKKISLIDAALRSSAAPVYFPSYQNYVDGGVYAVNPSLIAVSKAIDPAFGNKNIADIRLLSIGTGINPTGIEEDVDWDERRWMEPYGAVATHPLYSVITDMAAKVPEYPLEQILKEKYNRINAYLPVPVEMDDVKKIPILKKTAKEMPENQKPLWRESMKWIRSHISEG